MFGGLFFLFKYNSFDKRNMRIYTMPSFRNGQIMESTVELYIKWRKSLSHFPPWWEFIPSVSKPVYYFPPWGGVIKSERDFIASREGGPSVACHIYIFFFFSSFFVLILQNRLESVWVRLRKNKGFRAFRVPGLYHFDYKMAYIWAIKPTAINTSDNIQQQQPA